MARKEATFTATDGRDQGKRYLIREMSASHAESWALRTMLAIGRAGIEVPELFRQQGFAGLLTTLQNSSDAELNADILSVLKTTLFANLLRLDASDAMPLLAEMMECVQRIETHITRPLVDEDTEEVSTRLKLRGAVWNLHTDFFEHAALSTSESGPAAKAEPLLTIKTPPRPSAP